MVFSSLTFIFLFLPIVTISYFLFKNIQYRNFILFFSSVIFYAWGEPIYIVIMMISTLNDYLAAIVIDRAQRNNQKEIAKIALTTAIVINLLLLGFFKYADFLVSTINAIIGTHIGLLHLPLPVGISFYTFQTMSYTIDVYRGEVKVQKNFLTLSTFVTMFHQLIAGPIVRYETIELELQDRTSSWDEIAKGIRRLIIGLAKKVIIANQMGIIADTIFKMADQDRGLLLAWVGILAYAFQIYFDFSGYSDMAIGMGWMFGFHFLENFNYPYISRSITEFWRRWHISLSTWFRDYVYIPLGGNRLGAWKWLRNIMIVWFLTGLWHGAAWNFVLWGLYFGILLVIERLFLLNLLKKLPFLGYLYAMTAVLFGWVLFRSESLPQIFHYTKSLLGFNGTNSLVDLTRLNLVYLIPFMLIAMIGATPLPRMIFSPLAKYKVPVIIFDAYHVIIFGLAIMFLVNESFNPFIYYRF